MVIWLNRDEQRKLTAFPVTPESSTEGNIALFLFRHKETVTSDGYRRQTPV